MSTPRIYIAIATFYPLIGGAEVQAHLQGCTLRERGYEATIVTFRHDKQWPSREVIAGVPVTRVAGTLLGDRKHLPKAFRKLLYMLALFVMGWTLWCHRHRYDILHVYQLSLLTLPAALVCRLTGKPMIIAVRSSGSGKGTGIHRTASLVAGPLDPTTPWLRIDERTWGDGELESFVRLGKFVVQLTRSLLTEIQAVVVVLSSRMKHYLAAHDFLLPNMQLIPNGVDTSRFCPISGNAINSTRAHVVVCVSNLRYEKGIDVLLQAWHLVHEQSPQTRLIIVGDGPLQSQLECMAEALSIADSVEFAGLQSNIPAQLHRGGIAVLPSRSEGMPNAVLEAMACGLPCVATRVSGSEDIIEHEVNGLLVEPEDYEGLAQALLTLLRNPAVVQRYGDAARSTIEKRYGLDHITDMYIELYQRVFTRKGRGPERISEPRSHSLSS